MTYTLEQKKKHRELWCQALESSEFKQGRRQLQSPKPWVGLNSTQGIYGEAGYALTDDNDTEKLSFAEIAEIIRSEPHGLFDE